MARTKIAPEANDQEMEGNHASSNAMVPSQGGSVARYETPAGYDADQYDDTSRDTTTPVLGLVGGIGPLSKTFRNQAGNFALGEICILGPSVDVIPVALVKYFVETYRNGKEIKFGSPESATRKIFQTAAFAAQAGYVVDFDNVAPNRIEENGRIGYLLKMPEGLDAKYAAEFSEKAPDGTRYAVVKCSYHRGGFRNTWRRIFDHAARLAKSKDISARGLSHDQLFAKAQAWTDLWTLAPIEKEKGDNTWFESGASRTAPLTPEVFNWVTEEFGHRSA